MFGDSLLIIREYAYPGKTKEKEDLVVLGTGRRHRETERTERSPHKYTYGIKESSRDRLTRVTMDIVDYFMDRPSFSGN